MNGAVAMVGDPDDLSTAYMRWLAGERGLDVLGLDESRLGLDWWFAAGDGPTGARLVVDGKTVAPTAVTGCFVRLNPRPAVPVALDEPEAAVFIRERRAGIHEFLERVPWMVVNRPTAGRGNGSKPFHMAMLVRQGFDVPEWLVVNDPRRAAAFAALFRDGCVYKACSGLRSRVRLADDALLKRLATPTTPVVMQRFVPGHDVRLHVIGPNHAATSVSSTGVDYRFDECETSYEPVAAPDEVASRCVEFARRSSLILAGFDFRVDPDGRWWCLEVNPVPTFLPYEAATGHPIGELVLDVMAPHSTRRRARSVLAL